MDRFELEERLIEFAAQIIELTEKLPSTYAAAHLYMTQNGLGLTKPILVSIYRTLRVLIFPNLSIVGIAKQIIRSGTSPALNYGEAQVAESRADFIHKIKIALKELNETHVCLKILKRRDYLKSGSLETILTESKELISIFTASLKTAQSKRLKGK